MWVLALLVSYGLPGLLLAGLVWAGWTKAYRSQEITGRAPTRSERQGALIGMGAGIVLLLILGVFFVRSVMTAWNTPAESIEVKQAMPDGQLPPVPTNVPYR